MDGSVLVRVQGPDPQGLKLGGRSFYAVESGRTTLSGSGFVSRSGGRTVVVTSASVLAPFFKLDQQGKPDGMIEGARVDVYLESGEWREAAFAQVVSLDSVKSAAEKLIGAKVKLQRGVHVGCVALLQVVQGGDAVTPLCCGIGQECNRGDEISVIASPFGLVSPTVFQNSVTSGVVSNVVHDSTRVALLLTDARCLPGSEGAPVFNRSGELIGMVSSTVERPDGSKLELGTVIPVALFSNLLELKLVDSGTSLDVRNCSVQQGSSNMIADAVFGCSESVVMITINSSWGSGVVVSTDGHILTCAHLFRPFVLVDKRTHRLRLRHPSTRITVSIRNGGVCLHCAAELVFCSKGAIDVALLKIQSTSADMSIKSVKFSTGRIQAGTRCVAIGHAIFLPTTNLSATVSSGVISRVVCLPRDKTTPAIVQTCASVFRGHSGGLLADETGRFIGILTSNARHSNGDIIPTINFSIPYAMLQPLIEIVLEGGEPSSPNVQSVFDMYDREDPELLSLWRLESDSQPPPQADALSRFDNIVEQLKAKL
uniref:Uncharacterized protein n=1 Tax=Mucochytrium quahogii TaxID=96639 RepID=A0A7S2SQ07_9STRA|mmetsp:Transcript_9300/g.15132  ORF Transcript_9300/g.15132 Transcript_9300/m.15132 type:complete len:541 (+) Transcript_9300:242-1864(+)